MTPQPSFPNLTFMGWPAPGQVLADHARFTREVDRERRFQKIERQVYVNADVERTTPKDEFDMLMTKLPGWLQEYCRAYERELEEIKLDLGVQAVLTMRGKEVVLPQATDHKELSKIVTNFDGFRDDNRTGLNRTLHRISKLPGVNDTTGGITIRMARHVVGAADDLLPYILEKRAILLIGVPGVGKTTLLREVIRHLAERYGTKVVVVDTSSEVTGAGQIGHWATMPARRILVSDKKIQPELIRQAYANHSPMFIAVDEIGHHGDADAVASTVDRGVGMVATCHGETLANVVNTQTFWPVMGAIREHGMERRRMTEASFDVAVEVRGVGRFIVHERVSEAVDEVLAGREPRGRRVGKWPNLRTG